MTAGPGSRVPRGAARVGALGLVAAVCVAAPPPSHAQDDFGTTAAIALRLPFGARTVALGDAYTAVRGDELSLFYNPGSLASAPGISAGGSYQSWLATSELVTLSAALPIGPGVLGLGAHSLDFGSVEEIVEDPRFGGQTGERTGREVAAREFVGGLAYGLRLLEPLGVGLGAKVVRSEIAGAAGTAVAADIGARWEAGPERGLSVGASLQNLGTEIELAGRSDPLPLSFRIGGAYRLVRGEGPLDGLVALDVVVPRGGAARLSAGVEADRRFGDVRLAGRAGLRAANANESLGDVFTLGGGLEIGGFRLDYAYMGFDVFGGTHRVGLRWAAAR